VAYWPELIERAAAAYNARDADAFAALCTPDAEILSMIAIAQGGEPFRGSAGIRSWFREMEEAFESVFIEAERVYDLGDLAIIDAHLRNRGRASGAEVEIRLAQALWGRDRAIARVSLHDERDAAARALGFDSLNVALTMRHHQAWKAGDFEGTIAMMDPDLEWDTREGMPDGSAARGIDAAVAFTRSFVGTWRDLSVEPLEYTGAGPYVLVRCRTEGRGRASGVHVVNEVFQLWTFDDARIVRFALFDDEAAARAAAGLSSP
jgi:ketosteroid isomerase-like protein